MSTAGLNVFSQEFSVIEKKASDTHSSLIETGWLLKNHLKASDGIEIHLVDKKTEQLLAFAIITRGEENELAKTSSTVRHALSNCLFINAVWILPNYKENNLLPAILYFVLRRGRILRRKHIVSYLQNQDGAIPMTLQLKPLDKLQSVKFDGLIPMAQTLDYAIYLAYQGCHGEILNTVKHYFIDEIKETVDRWLESFFQGSWAQAIYRETITKQQYIATLCHWYQFVRQTTQHIARAITYSENRELRNHYIYHLKGEINHEIMIENDLKQFNYDLDFLMNFQLPSEATKKFMMVQETAIGFYQNPVLLLACPLAAEGMTAYIKPDFLEALYRCIAQWGIVTPKSAAKFISSHVNTDGGDDGHWNRVLVMTSKFIVNEKLMQDYLSVLYTAMDTYLIAHNATIDDFKLWEATLNV